MNAIIHSISARKSRRGAIALEYALVLAFVAVSIVTILVALGGKLTTTVNGIGDTTATASSSFK